MKVESRSLISLECDMKEGTSGFGTPNQLDRPVEEVSTFCLLLELLLPELLAALLLIADQNKHANLVQTAIAQSQAYIWRL